MSKSAGQNPPQDLRQILFDKLNEHGYLFREKCAQTLQDNQRTTKWQVLVEEYPVSTVSRDARIDFVLKDTSQRRPRFETYAIVECKRVNPSRGYWLFGNPTITQFDSPLLINVTSQGGTRGLAPVVHFVQLRPQLDLRAYLIDNWWLQIAKKNESKKGVEYNSSPDPIEIALSQVCIGVSGLAQELATNLNGDFSALSVVYIPVVITSAPLYVAEYDVADVNLASGDIDQDKIHFVGASLNRWSG